MCASAAALRFERPGAQRPTGRLEHVHSTGLLIPFAGGGGGCAAAAAAAAAAVAGCTAKLLVAAVTRARGAAACRCGAAAGARGQCRARFRAATCGLGGRSWKPPWLKRQGLLGAEPDEARAVSVSALGAAAQDSEDSDDSDSHDPSSLVFKIIKRFVEWVLAHCKQLLQPVRLSEFEHIRSASFHAPPARKCADSAGESCSTALAARCSTGPSTGPYRRAPTSARSALQDARRTPASAAAPAAAQIYWAEPADPGKPDPSHRQGQN